MMKVWNCAQDAFQALNEQIDYLVIRNFEEFYDALLLEDHADIDLLCRKEDRKRVIALLGAVPRLERKDAIHYCFQVGEERIPLDIRTVGDGYYCGKWGLEMLRTRIQDPRGFYRMNQENYFWSLVYHCLYHKGKITQEYQQRLQFMLPEQFSADQNQLEQKLSDYMNVHGYVYSIARDRYLWYHFTPICEGRIQRYPFYRTEQFLRKFKNVIDVKLLGRADS